MSQPITAEQIRRHPASNPLPPNRKGCLFLHAPLMERVVTLFSDKRWRTYQDVYIAMRPKGHRNEANIRESMGKLRKRGLLHSERHSDSGLLLWRAAQ